MNNPITRPFTQQKVLAFAVLSILISLLSFSNTAHAYLTDRTTVSSQITGQRQPVITGTIPTWCNDVAVVVTTDTASGADGSFYFFSDYGQVQLSGGNWSLDLANVGLGLVNGVYNVAVLSECDYSGSYDDPLYADYHYDVLRIVPASCDSYCVPVHRFYNIRNGAHFYTTTEHEKRSVMAMDAFRYEGITAFAKDFRTVIDGMTPVHRFYNFKQGVHFYTANQAEASYVNNNLGHTFRYEGISYQSHSNAGPHPSLVAVHRFYKFKQGIHFYTANQAEASQLHATGGATYRYEGVSYYLIGNNN